MAEDWREKARRQQELRKRTLEALKEFGAHVYSLPPDQRPYGQRGKYPKPPYYPKLPDGSSFCRWCACRVKGRKWCSAECVQAFMLRGHWPTMAAHITRRDQVCRLCFGQRWSITKPYRYYSPRDGWPHGKDGWKSEACRLQRDFAVDHIVAVKDGGTDDPQNLRLLCIRCHQEVTREQHARWSAARRAARHGAQPLQVSLLEGPPAS